MARGGRAKGLAVDVNYLAGQNGVCVSKKYKLE
jgi:hypothetical protein